MVEDLFMFIWYAGISYFFFKQQLQRVMMIILGGPKTDRSCPHVLSGKNFRCSRAAECEIGASNREKISKFLPFTHQNSITIKTVIHSRKNFEILHFLLDVAKTKFFRFSYDFHTIILRQTTIF